MYRNEKYWKQLRFDTSCCYMEKENLSDQINNLIAESTAVLKQITEIRKKADRFLWVLQTGKVKTAGRDAEAASEERLLSPEKEHEELFVRKLTVKKSKK